MPDDALTSDSESEPDAPVVEPDERFSDVDGADQVADPAVHPRYLRKMTPWFFFAGATVTFRERFWRVWGVAAFIAVSSSLLDTALDQLVEEHYEHLPVIIGFMLAATSIMLTGANSFGSVFLSGVLDKTVGEHQHGHREMPLREVFRTLPWMTLFIADIIVVAARGVGLAVLFPGFIVVTLTAVVGPVIIIENRKAWSAIKRSAQLVWPHFWLVLATVTVPLGIEGFVEKALEELPVFHSVLGHTVIGLMLEVPLITWVALVEVTLAYHLLERDTPGTITSLAH